MKCPLCVEQGLRSTVRSLGATVTLLGHRPWWDEDGVYHSHDPNRHTMEFCCSKEHIWRSVSHLPCPAGDYGGEEPTIILSEPGHRP
jgi:hypothetical protein